MVGIFTTNSPLRLIRSWQSVDGWTASATSGGSRPAGIIQLTVVTFMRPPYSVVISPTTPGTIRRRAKLPGIWAFILSPHALTTALAESIPSREAEPAQRCQGQRRCDRLLG